MGSYQIWLPKTLTHSKQLITRRSAYYEVLCEIDTSDTVKAANKRLPARMVDARYYWRDKVRTKPPLIQTAGHEVGHGLGRDGALFAETVHVYFVAEEIGDGGDVGGEAGETQVDIAEREDLGVVVGDGEGLETEAEIAGYGYTVFSDHGYAGTAVDGER